MKLFGWLNSLFDEADTAYSSPDAWESTFLTQDVVSNPANGLPMIGGFSGVDAMGNSYGTGWCCFPSVLARIVNVQGRAQLGKDFGDPKGPDCSGFTIQELERLRFDEMDLSEFIDQITARVTTNTYAVDRIQQRAASYYGQP